MLTAAAAVCLSVRWRMLPDPQALQGGGGLWGAGVSQLRGCPPRACPGLGIGHQCSAHPAGPVCPLEGRQSHRLDRGAYLLRRVFHSSETVWGETQPRPLQWVNSSSSTHLFEWGELMLWCIHLETPDSVSIRPVNHTGPMVEGKEYQLLCEVQNIAPVQYLTLRWYRGQTEVYNHSFSDLTSSSPVQVSSILVITPTKAENGAQYRCVAVLGLGPEGPHPPPTVTSEPLNASVYCKSWSCSQSVREISFVQLQVVHLILSDTSNFL